jgi:hypothetical protein
VSERERQKTSEWTHGRRCTYRSFFCCHTISRVIPWDTIQLPALGRSFDSWE